MIVKDRDISIDNIKVFAIILVVLGHSLQYIKFDSFYGPNNEYNNVLFTCIYMFHMPLFIYVSGIFHKNIDSGLAFLWKNFRRLIVPMFSWAILCVIYNYIATDIAISFESYLKTVFFGWWYIWCLVECRIALFLFCKLKNRYWKISFLLLLYIVLPYIPIPRINFFLSLFPFYLVAYYVHNKSKNFLEIYQNRIICVLLIIVFIVFLCFWNDRYSMYSSKYDITNIVNYWYFFSRLLAGFSGIYICIFFFKKFFFGLNKLTVIGRDTLGIYILQYFYCSLLRNNVIEISSIYMYYLCSFVSMSLCLLISLSVIRLMKRFKLFEQLFFGTL